MPRSRFTRFISSSERQDASRVQEKQRAYLKTILAAAVIVVLVVTVKRFDLQQVFRDLLAWIADLGPLMFIALYIIACVLLLPGSILTLGTGVVFAVVMGSIAVSIGSTLGATCAFLVGRYLARGWV